MTTATVAAVVVRPAAAAAAVCPIIATRHCGANGRAPSPARHIVDDHSRERETAATGKTQIGAKQQSAILQRIWSPDLDFGSAQCRLPCSKRHL